MKAIELLKEAKDVLMPTDYEGCLAAFYQVKGIISQALAGLQADSCKTCRGSKKVRPMLTSGMTDYISPKITCPGCKQAEPECKHTIGTGVDEDGCCVSCGEDLNYIAVQVEPCKTYTCSLCKKALLTLDDFFDHECPDCKSEPVITKCESHVGASDISVVRALREVISKQAEPCKTCGGSGKKYYPEPGGSLSVPPPFDPCPACAQAEPGEFTKKLRKYIDSDNRGVTKYKVLEACDLIDSQQETIKFLRKYDADIDGLQAKCDNQQQDLVWYKIALKTIVNMRDTVILNDIIGVAEQALTKGAI